MRVISVLLLVVIIGAFIAGCASTMSASGNGGNGSSRSALLEEIRGQDTIVIDKFGRTMGSNDWIDEPWMFRFKRLSR